MNDGRIISLITRLSSVNIARCLFLSAQISDDEPSVKFEIFASLVAVADPVKDFNSFQRCVTEYFARFTAIEDPDVHLRKRHADICARLANLTENCAEDSESPVHVFMSEWRQGDDGYVASLRGESKSVYLDLARSLDWSNKEKFELYYLAIEQIDGSIPVKINLDEIFADGPTLSAVIQFYSRTLGFVDVEINRIFCLELAEIFCAELEKSEFSGTIEYDSGAFSGDDALEICELFASGDSAKDFLDKAAQIELWLSSRDASNTDLQNNAFAASLRAAEFYESIEDLEKAYKHYAICYDEFGSVLSKDVEKEKKVLTFLYKDCYRRDDLPLAIRYRRALAELEESEDLKRSHYDLLHGWILLDDKDGRSDVFRSHDAAVIIANANVSQLRLNFSKDVGDPDVTSSALLRRPGSSLASKRKSRDATLSKSSRNLPMDNGMANEAKLASLNLVRDLVKAAKTFENFEKKDDALRCYKKSLRYMKRIMLAGRDIGFSEICTQEGHLMSEFDNIRLIVRIYLGVLRLSQYNVISKVIVDSSENSRKFVFKKHFDELRELTKKVNVSIYVIVKAIDDGDYVLEREIEDYYTNVMQEMCEYLLRSTTDRLQYMQNEGLFDFAHKFLYDDVSWRVLDNYYCANANFNEAQLFLLESRWQIEESKARYMLERATSSFASVIYCYRDRPEDARDLPPLLHPVRLFESALRYATSGLDTEHVTLRKGGELVKSFKPTKVGVLFFTKIEKLPLTREILSVDLPQQLDGFDFVEFIQLPAFIRFVFLKREHISELWDEALQERIVDAYAQLDAPVINDYTDVNEVLRFAWFCLGKASCLDIMGNGNYKDKLSILYGQASLMFNKLLGMMIQESCDGVEYLRNIVLVELYEMIEKTFIRTIEVYDDAGRQNTVIEMLSNLYAVSPSLRAGIGALATHKECVNDLWRSFEKHASTLEKFEVSRKDISDDALNTVEKTFRKYLFLTWRLRDMGNEIVVFGVSLIKHHMLWFSHGGKFTVDENYALMVNKFCRHLRFFLEMHVIEKFSLIDEAYDFADHYNVKYFNDRYAPRVMLAVCKVIYASLHSFKNDISIDQFYSYIDDILKFSPYLIVPTAVYRVRHLLLDIPRCLDVVVVRLDYLYRRSKKFQENKEFVSRRAELITTRSLIELSNTILYGDYESVEKRLLRVDDALEKLKELEKINSDAFFRAKILAHNILDCLDLLIKKQQNDNDFYSDEEVLSNEINLKNLNALKKAWGDGVRVIYPPSRVVSSSYTKTYTKKRGISRHEQLKSERKEKRLCFVEEVTQGLIADKVDGRRFDFARSRMLNIGNYL